MRTLAQIVAVPLVLGFIGAYFWPIALTAAAAFGLTYWAATRALESP